MWKCPNCETVNNSDRCMICGEKKPSTNLANDQNAQNQNHSGSEQSQGNINSNSNFVEKKEVSKTNKGLIALCITLCVLLLATVALILVIVLNNGNDDNAIDHNRRESSYEENDGWGENDENMETNETEDEHHYEEETMVPEMDEYLDPNDSDNYLLYTNYTYDFSCAYPANFYEVKSEGMNAVKTFESYDGSALMTIRACDNTYNIDIETAMSEFYGIVDGNVTYDANGETWYASSVDLGDRLLYRKCFIENGNILCFDFEFDEIDVDYYGDLIEYIEDNFKSF